MMRKYFLKVASEKQHPIVTSNSVTGASAVVLDTPWFGHLFITIDLFVVVDIYAIGLVPSHDSDPYYEK